MDAGVASVVLESINVSDSCSMGVKLWLAQIESGEDTATERGQFTMKNKDGGVIATGKCSTRSSLCFC